MSKGSSSSSQSTSPWGPAQWFLRDGMNKASALYNSGGYQLNYDQQVAGLTDDQKAILQGTIANAGTNNGNLSDIMGSLQGIANGSNADGNWDTIRDNTIADIMPGINSSFAGSGMTGSTAHARTLSDGLANGLATARVGYDQQQIDNQLGASGAIGQLQQIMNGNNAAALDAANVTQQQNQNQLDVDYQNDLQNQGSAASALQDYMNIITGVGSMGGTGTSSQKQSLGLMGTIGAGAGLLSLFSDRRLKTDIKRVGRTDNGLPIYTYRYKGSARVHMGVMAQDVQAVKPEAVADMGGYLGVNYGAL